MALIKYTLAFVCSPTRNKHVPASTVKSSFQTLYNIKTIVLESVTLDNLADHYQWFGGTCCLIFRANYSEDGSITLLWNTGNHLPDHMVLHPTGQ
jgi:hypothetical protein